MPVDDLGHDPGQELAAPTRNQAKALPFRPTSDLIPAVLLPVQREILAFWPKRKGQKTLKAWKSLMGGLIQIQDHPAGGTDAVREQLVKGIEKWESGNPWQSITLDNWLRFGAKTNQPRGRLLPGQTTTGGDLVAEMAAIFGEPVPTSTRF